MLAELRVPTFHCRTHMDCSGLAEIEIDTLGEDADGKLRRDWIFTGFQSLCIFLQMIPRLRDSYQAGVCLEYRGTLAGRGILIRT